MMQNRPIEESDMGVLPLKENWGGMKNQLTSVADKTVDISPGMSPPIQELINTVGRNRSHAYGRIADQNTHCRPNAIIGGNIARDGRNQVRLGACIVRLQITRWSWHHQLLALPLCPMRGVGYLE